MPKEDYFERVYDIVSRIPAGTVTTYGAIAQHLGLKSSARMVGWALNKTFESSAMNHLPCHRVVNRNGELSGKAWFGGNSMEELLRSEGITFTVNGCVEKKHFWNPSDEAQ